MIKPNIKKVAIIAVSVLTLLWLIKKARQRRVQKYINAIERAYDMTLSIQQEESILRLYNKWLKFGDGDENKFIYILATIKHESRFLPVREGFTKSAKALEAYLDKNGYWYASGANRGYGGRGYVQITLKSNYEDASKKIGVDLVSNPERALDMDIAAEIAIRGMLEGWFSANKPLNTWIDTKNGKVDFLNARRNVNAMDRATLIETYAYQLQNELNPAIA